MQIGNAVINDETDTIGMYQYFGTHALVSPRTISQLESQCNFTPGAANQTKACLDAAEEVGKNIDYLNIYNIYAPLCFDTNVTAKPKIPAVSHSHSSNCYSNSSEYTIKGIY